ncbi:MAG: type II secretion system protein GspG [Pseudomonadota bacterium]
MRTRTTGFTLMEMIGVVAVIAILAAMATPMIFDAIRDARITAIANEVSTLRTAVARYYADTGRVPENIPLDSNVNNDLLIRNSASGVPGWNGPYIETHPKNPWQGDLDTQVGPMGSATNYFDLDGNGTFETGPSCRWWIDNPVREDARILSDMIDGDGDVDTGSGAWFSAGQVRLNSGNDLVIYLGCP